MRKFIGVFISILLLAIPNAVFAGSLLEDMNGWLERQLSANGSSVSAYLFLLVGGMLASLLPCTYPLYPITVNVLRAGSSGTNKYSHPVTYFIGIISMYFLFGIIAVITGGAFNSVLRLPFTNLTIAVVIFLLGLSSLDLLHLPIFTGTSAQAGKRKSSSTFLMGMGAGLLSSACVGPVVVSILIGIASSSATFSLGAGLTAASKMLMFGIGVGLPFLLIGVFGMSLPKSGKWMKYVQLALGVMIVYFAYVYLEKALLGYGFTETTIQLIAVGALVVLFSIYLLQPQEQLAHSRMRKSLLVLSSIIGSLVLVRAFIPQMQGNTIALKADQPATPKTEQKGALTWYLDREAAYAAAREKSKPVFIDFHADWCTNCKEFQKLTQSDTGFNAILQNAVLLKVYDATPAFNAYASDKRFPELKVGLPFFVITDKDENLLFKTNDYLKTDEMGLFLSN